MESRIKGKLDQVLSMFTQAEQDKTSQTVQVIRVLEKEKIPRKPAEIAGLTGLKQPSVRRIIQTLVRSGIAKRHPSNKYSIIN